MGNKKILIVEDDVVLREVLAGKLSQKGYEVSSVEDGELALTEIKRQKPDLILLDILMPRKGGMEVMEELNKDNDLNKIPIIVISNSGQPVEVQRARELGAKEFLIKAVFDPSEVLEKVEKILKDAEKEAEKNSASFGEIIVEDGGTEKTIELNEAEPKVETKNEEDVENKEVPVSSGSRGGQKKVLVVEDDKFLRELFVRKLFNEGFDVESAIDSVQVFEILAKKKPEVVLLDLILPGVNGFEILAQIKKDNNLKDIPVMVISNLGQKEDVDRALDLGAADFLIKANYTLDEIITRVLIVLEK